MSNTYTGKSPRNARIKIDYTGESPSVKFNYPRKDSYVGSMFSEFVLLWIILLYFGTVIIGFGFTFGYDQGMNLGGEEKPLLIPEAEPMIEYVEYQWYIFDWQKTTLEKLLSFGKACLGAFIFFIILFGPPHLANKIWGKNLFPKYQGWKANKKYVKLTKKDVKVELVNKKKLTYVEIPYFENVILNYESTGDFSKYLDIIEIQEHNFKTEELGKRKKKRKTRNIKKQNEWYWYAKFYFSKKPITGELKVIFK